jgi:hypothetical protein
MESALTLMVVSLSLFWSWTEWKASRRAAQGGQQQGQRPGAAGGSGSNTKANLGAAQKPDAALNVGGFEQRLASVERRLEALGLGAAAGGSLEQRLASLEARLEGMERQLGAQQPDRQVQQGRSSAALQQLAWNGSK